MPLARIADRLVYFAHVPRCGGTAVEAYLAERFGPLALLDDRWAVRGPVGRWSRSSPQHMDREALGSLFPPGFLDRSFAVVRHPADRLRSVFLFQQRVERTIPPDLSLGAWLRGLAGAFDHERHDNHARPMDDLVPEDATVFRLEDGLDPLVGWLDALAGDASGPRAIGRRNAMDQRAEAAAYGGPADLPALTPADHALVERLHAADYARFGYERRSGAGADAPAEAGAPRRTVVLHYHLFKNAGTSVDRLLRDAFGPRWVTREFDQAGGDNGAAVAAWIASEPQAVAFSTHTALGPLPPVEGVEVIGVLLLRDPIDRIRSAYRFERRQEADTYGARLAKAEDLEGYVRARLARPGDRQCRNFQTARLASLWPGPGPELERATRALDLIPVLGLVERFDEAMARLAAALRPVHPGFEPGPSTENRGEGAAEMSDGLDRLLREANRDDLELLARARRRLGA